MDQNNIFEWQGTVFAPVGSAYEGGIFTIQFQLPANYPFGMPAVKFERQIYILISMCMFDWVIHSRQNLESASV